VSVTGTPETASPTRPSRWETLVWPQWLPISARLPLIALIAGGTALVAAIAMPRWSDVPPPSTPPPLAQLAVVNPSPLAEPALVNPSPLPPAADPTPAAPLRPAYLNLDVRHAFRAVDLSITVDGKRALDTTLTGSGKRFGVFGKRAERGFTKTLGVRPGVRIVGVRLRSEPDKFDQTRVERFDLDSASVATLRIAADKSGLSIVAERPPAAQAPPAAPEPPVAQTTPVTPVTPVMQAPQLQVAQAQATQTTRPASALAELYKSLRSMLIAIAGFVSSTATAFVVQEFLKSRRGLTFRSQSRV
jgi:hypothetical protein